MTVQEIQVITAGMESKTTGSLVGGAHPRRWCACDDVGTRGPQPSTDDEMVSQVCCTRLTKYLRMEWRLSERAVT